MTRYRQNTTKCVFKMPKNTIKKGLNFTQKPFPLSLTPTPCTLFTFLKFIIFTLAICCS